jgi:hypothetical protein
MKHEHSLIGDLEKASNEGRDQMREENFFTTDVRQCSSPQDIARAAKEKPRLRFGDTSVDSPAPSARFEIRVPHKGFRGEQYGVKFEKGIGWTDDDGKARWFQHTGGYEVIDHKAGPAAA